MLHVKLLVVFRGTYDSRAVFEGLTTKNRKEHHLINYSVEDIHA